MQLIKAFMRVFNNRINGDEERSLLRNLYFNLLRNLTNKVLRSIIIGHLDTDRLFWLALYTSILTIVFEKVPKSLLNSRGPLPTYLARFLQFLYIFTVFEGDMGSGYDFIWN